MSIYPDFYGRFACRAGACRHSCCRGWEIDVDEDSAAYYETVPGELGAKLRRSITRDAYGAHFLLTEDERCPFLRADGLCELIRSLGEGALCDICALHPRFFEEAGEEALCGLGLSCEAVCELLLDTAGELAFINDEDSETMTMPVLLRHLGLKADPASLRFDGAPPSAEYLRRLAETEAIDRHWPGELAAVAEATPPRLPVGPRYDRILQYLLYRQLERAEEAGMERLLRYARESTAFVAAQDALFGTDGEHLRRFSEQVEYSTENASILLGLSR